MSFLRVFKIFCAAIGLIFLIQIYLYIRIKSTDTEQRKQNAEYQGSAALESSSTLTHKSNITAKHGFTFSKDLEIPIPCDVTEHKDVISAVQRATTNDCKSQILDVACKIKYGQFYPKTLPNTCPNAGRKHQRYIGCFKDSHDDRLLSNYFVLLKTNNSPSKCVQVCLQSGFIYAGTQYS